MFGFLSMSLSAIVVFARACRSFEISCLTLPICESSLTTAPSDRHPHFWLDLSGRGHSRCQIVGNDEVADSFCTSCRSLVRRSRPDVSAVSESQWETTARFPGARLFALPIQRLTGINTGRCGTTSSSCSATSRRVVVGSWPYQAEGTGLRVPPFREGRVRVGLPNSTGASIAVSDRSAIPSLRAAAAANGRKL